MNKLFLAAAIMALGTGSAFASEYGQSSGTRQQQAQQQQTQAASQAGSVSYVDNRTNVPEVQTINTNATVSGGTYNETKVSGTQTLKNVPTVYAPNLITSNDTCMGSSSIGAGGPGFGFSFGTSWTDANCIMLKNAREMYNMGMPDVAFARLCMDELNRDAIELSGRVCPQKAREDKQAAAEAAKNAPAPAVKTSSVQKVNDSYAANTPGLGAIYQ